VWENNVFRRKITAQNNIFFNNYKFTVKELSKYAYLSNGGSAPIAGHATTLT
jgi:hypothetical protein